MRINTFSLKPNFACPLQVVCLVLCSDMTEFEKITNAKQLHNHIGDSTAILQPYFP